MKVLLAGGGYVGAEFCNRALARGADVTLVKRTAVDVPPGARLILADLSDKNLSLTLPDGIDVVVYSLSSDEHGDDAYRRAYVDALANLLRLLESVRDFRGRICFISSTAVYGQEGGEEVDESSPTEPTHFSGLRLLEAEALLRSSRAETIALRFGGIYGPGRTRIIDEVRTGRAWRSVGAPQFTNRIHRDDCAAMIEHLVFSNSASGVYNGVDCEPAARNDVVSWIANRLGVTDPPLESGSRIDGMRGNKRCLNKKILQSGYVFQFPTFREGYGSLILKG